MKKLFTTLAITGALIAPAIAQNKQLQIPTSMIGVNGEVIVDEKAKLPIVYVEKIAGGRVWFRYNSNDSEIQQKKLSEIKSIYQSRPEEYVAAVELFENRQYENALTAFKDFKKKYKAFNEIDNSFPALAGYYELACLRKLKQYEELAKKEPLFADGKWLTKDSQQAQLKIYKLWTHLADKAYPKVIKEYEASWLEKKLPNSLRAQVEFVYGKSLEAEGRSEDALIAFCKAMNADFAGSEVLTLEAVTAVFNVIENDKEVQRVRELWDNNEVVLLKPLLNTTAFLRLIDAAAFVRVHDKFGFSGYDGVGDSIKLPEQFRKYEKYTKEASKQFMKKEKEKEKSK